jgi:hypothetical protein
MHNLAIWGWWQGKNLGDNWIKSILASIYKDADFIDTDSAKVSDFDFIVIGGGGLFIRGVIPPWDKYSKSNFGVLGLGAEFEHETSRANELSKLATFFYVRDKYSLECMHLDKKHLSYDTTFYSPIKSSPKKNSLKEVLFVWREPDVLLRFEDFRRYIGDTSLKYEWKAVLEANFTKIVESDFGGSDNYIYELLDEVDFVVSARFHGVVAAIQKGIPCIGIDIVPKIRSIMKDVGIEEYCIKLSEIDRLQSLIKSAKENQKDIREKMLSFKSKANEMLTFQVDEGKRKIVEYCR